MLDALSHGLVEEEESAAACGLGFVHGGIGVAEHIFGGLSGHLAGDDADAGGADDFAVHEVEGLSEEREDTFGDDIGVLFGVEAFEEDDELIAAEASGECVGLSADGVGGSDGVSEAGGDFGEEEVAGGMSEAIVDEFEAIEIEEEDGVAFVL